MLREFLRVFPFAWFLGVCSVLAGSAAVSEEEPLTYRRFSVIEKDGRVARVVPIAADPLPLWARDVGQESDGWSGGPEADRPYFEPPIPFVIPPPEGSGEPFYSHNHVPDITWLPNGDLMAAWYTTRREQGTELTVLASRLRAGREQWDPAYEFFRADERNMHCTALFYDDAEGLLHHFNGMGRQGATGWAELALLHRTSRDNGVTWTVAAPVSSGANYQARHMPIAGMFRTGTGALVLPVDATPGGEGPSAIHVSRDGGRTWTDPGGDIRGIHAGAAELADGRLLAFGRGQAIDGRMPISISADVGETWTYSASEFPPIGGGQRLVLMRLREGPLMFVSFTSGDRRKPGAGRVAFPDQSGREFIGHGMFAALSFDDGQTWPVRKLLTPGQGEYDGGAWTGQFRATATRAEHAGYLAATQTPDNVIHLISSRLHYRFNLAWLKQPAERQRQSTASTNSLGMEMNLVEPGSLMMGSEEVYKEHPVHKVHISKPFRMSATQVTNEQYEQFDPEHRKLRGKFGLSKDDDEAVIFVSWHDAVAFCRWLSEKEGIPYRLPTEAEWEYAARAGTTTRYNTGDTLPDEFHRNQRSVLGAQPVALHVGQTTPNAWGFYDMHGLVEEWVSDWYGPYTAEEKTDPVGRADGAVKVTRGGSHGTTVEYLRSATRLGTLPEDKSWLIGFRVVQAEPLDTEPLPPEPLRRWAKDVCQEPREWERKIEEPYFRGPIPFVNIPVESRGPTYCDLTITYGHVNHVPAVTWCANGDLIAAWFSCSTGSGGGRMMTTAASRLRVGSEEWTEADVFFNAPGRNQTGTSLFQDGDGILYWYNGLSSGENILHNNALVTSTSDNHGVTWSRPTLVYADRNDPINAVTIMDNITLDVTLPSTGRHVLYTDNNNARMRGGSTALMFINRENGDVAFSEGHIAGIHATAVKLKDGRMLAVGRTLGEIEGLDKSKMPMSISRDGGNTWEYRDSEFPGIGGGQRNVLMRLQEGPLLLVSFTGPGSGRPGMLFEDRTGQTFRGYGMFAALSFDEGRTWPQRKLITPADGQTYNARGTVRNFRATHAQAEPRGYLTATQTPDGVVHLLSSGLHYRFNLAWLKQHPEPAPPPPSPADFESKAQLDRVFRPGVLPTAAGWRFTGSDARENEAVEVVEGTLRITTGPGQRVRWVDDSADGFGAARGAHTAEIAMRVTRSTADRRGIDFETYVPGIGRAFITVTTSAVYWIDGGTFVALAENLDNASRMHTYRLAVDSDGNVAIFRDGTPLGVRQATTGRDNLGGAAGAYLQWGEGAGGSEADAVVQRVAFDLQGAYRPGE